RWLALEANKEIKEHVEEFSSRCGSDPETVQKAFNAHNIALKDFENGFLEPTLENIVSLYIEYLEALAYAKEATDFFKYTDGEESIDKSDVYEQRRRVAQDLYIAWRNASSDYKKQNQNIGSFFKLRKRASWLDARTR